MFSRKKYLIELKLIKYHGRIADKGKKKKDGRKKGPQNKRGTPWRAITPIEDKLMGATAGTPLVEKPVSEWDHKQ